MELKHNRLADKQPAVAKAFDSEFAGHSVATTTRALIRALKERQSERHHLVELLG